jgi:hypothetical protein
MALLPCSEYGNKVSTSARTCPSCGFPHPATAAVTASASLCPAKRQRLDAFSRGEYVPLPARFNLPTGEAEVKKRRPRMRADPHLSESAGEIAHITVETRAPTRISRAPTRISRAPTRISRAPPRISSAPPRISSAPPRISSAPPRISSAPPRISRASTRSATRQNIPTTQTLRANTSKHARQRQ